MARKLLCLSLLCALSLGLMVGALVLTAPKGFVPPPMEPQAKLGVPEAPGEHYCPVTGEGLGFSAHVCGVFPVEDRGAQLWFTNDGSNGVWMKLRILDDRGKTLGESGLLRPGEYVQWVSLTRIPASGETLALKIMAYQPETYYSAGTLTLYTKIP